MRQPHNTTERQRQKALGRGEYLMQNQELDLNNSYNMLSGQPADHNNHFESQMMQRPNSIDVKSAAYYQQLQLQQQQQNQQLNQTSSINYNNINRQAEENIYMPRVLKNYDDSEPAMNSSPRNYPGPAHIPPPVTTAANIPNFGHAPLAHEEQLSPTRVIGSPSRPSQPPPAPPLDVGTPTRGSRANSNQRDSLPPPPPPPPTSESDNNLMLNGHSITNGGVPALQDEGVALPPPPPHPNDGLLSARVPVEHLPPSPPPPPAPINNSVATPTTSAGGAPPPVAPPPPPPPPPTDKMNGLSITNGDVAKNLKVCEF